MMWARAGHREGGSSEPYGTCWVGDVQGGSFSYLSDVWAGRVIGMPLLHAASLHGYIGVPHSMAIWPPDRQEADDASIWRLAYGN